MKYDLDQLMAQLQTKEIPDYLFFWGHGASPDGSITKSCFSQWWPSPFTVAGVEYKTAEHWMMSRKALLFGDIDIHDQIIAAHKPDIVKSLGRKVKDFDPKIWEHESFDIVVKGNTYKFSQHEQLASFLIGTGNKIIVEASPVDQVWGIGLAQNDSNALDPSQWKGRNLLGFALMEVRDILKNN